MAVLIDKILCFIVIYDSNIHPCQIQSKYIFLNHIILDVYHFLLLLVIITVLDKNFLVNFWYLIFNFHFRKTMQGILQSISTKYNK